MKLDKNQKGLDVIMSDERSKANDEKIEFNTYCFFTEEEKDIRQTIGLIFKDYIENLKVRNK